MGKEFIIYRSDIDRRFTYLTQHRWLARIIMWNGRYIDYYWGDSEEEAIEKLFRELRETLWIYISRWCTQMSHHRKLLEQTGKKLVFYSSNSRRRGFAQLVLWDNRRMGHDGWVGCEEEAVEILFRRLRETLWAYIDLQSTS